ncbi:MAG: DNA starvation/stationary phase protection protein [Prevotellaceae bacterium]|jgi:starvation-inducible DNA-binding protein|nr:DNA starvation/stationary phase protection protein [Prevotellaceae bacterium]
MKVTDYTGINAEDAGKVVKELQLLLADFQVFYTNLRGFHWNVKGQFFFALHAKFEEMYDDAAEKVDEIAERILMLGGTPEHNFSKYLKVAKVEETTAISNGTAMITNILDTLKYIIALERRISENADEATAALMSDYIREQEKTVWMLASTVA